MEVIIELTGEVIDESTGEVIIELTGEVIIALTGEVTTELMGEVTTELMGEMIIALTGEVITELTGEVTTELMGEAIIALTGEVITELPGGDIVAEEGFEGEAFVFVTLANACDLPLTEFVGEASVAPVGEMVPIVIEPVEGTEGETTLADALIADDIRSGALVAAVTGIVFD